MTYPGQPCKAAVTFVDDANAPEDPTEVKFTVTGPGSTGSTVYTYGTDANVTRTGTGAYSVIFTPTRGGEWSVDADGFDAQGNSVEAVEGTIPIQARRAPIPTP